MPGILAFQAIVFVCGTITLVSALQFVRWMLSRRRERRAQLPFDELAQRLERIESAVETTAIEVERILESNRFMAKLLAERTAPLPLPSRPERVITPH